MKAIILAAGKGTRLEHLGIKRPKCLLPIGDKPAILRLIDSIWSSGVIDEIVVVGGYRIEELREVLPGSVQLLANKAFATSNSIVSLKVALEYVGACDIAVFNSDVVYCNALVNRYLRHPKTTSCLADETSETTSGETYLSMADGVISGIEEDMDPRRVAGRVAQIFRISEDLFEGVIQDTDEIITEHHGDAYAGLVMNNLCLREIVYPVFTNGDFWHEFDTPDEYEAVANHIRNVSANEPGALSYGLVNSSPTGMLESEGAQISVAGHTRSPDQSIGKILSRIRACIKEGRMPSYLDRYFDVWRALFKKPIPAITNAQALLSRKLSRQGYQLRLYGADMLSDVMREAESIDVKPFLVFGSLLGSEREDGFIFDDGDVDLGLMEDDWHHIERLKNGMARRGYTVRRQDDDKISFLHPVVPNLHIDIDRFFSARECIWNKNETADESIIYSLYFHRKTFEGLVLREFEGTMVYVPENPDLFLTQVYGAWRIPQSKRDVRRGPLNLYIRSVANN